MTVYYGDATDLPLDDNSVHCVVTSPPYNVGIEYPQYRDQLEWLDYQVMAEEAVKEMGRVLVDGGRFWINVQAMVPEIPGQANGPRIDLLRIWSRAIESCRDFERYPIHIRDYIVWLQGRHDGGTAWGSWLMPTAPNMRGAHEMIIAGFKGEQWPQVPQPAQAL